MKKKKKTVKKKNDIIFHRDGSLTVTGEYAEMIWLEAKKRKTSFEKAFNEMLREQLDKLAEE